MERPAACGLVSCPRRLPCLQTPFAVPYPARASRWPSPPKTGTCSWSGWRCRGGGVGLRGYKLNPAVKTYLAAGPPVQKARQRSPRHRQHRIAKRLPAGTIGMIVAEYVAGTPAAELGRRYGVARSTVLTLLRAAGVPVLHPRLTTADRARVVALYGQGLPQTQIAAQLGRSPGAVWHVLHRAGLVGRRQSL